MTLSIFIADAHEELHDRHRKHHEEGEVIRTTGGSYHHGAGKFRPLPIWTTRGA